ncbi:MAG: hypothetical protein IAF38_10270, partial [Bacteroidia bacterium]|nr:hypothetical protein [Bacteroidia bacterium]
MLKPYKTLLLLSAIFLSGIFSNLKAQLNSVDGYFGINNFLNNYYPAKQPMGWNAGARYNIDLSWEFGLILGGGINNSTFNLATTRDLAGAAVPVALKHTYADITLGLEWQWMTEIRTRMQGGPTKARGSKEIMFANFKSYLVGGIDYKFAMNTPSTYSNKNVMNWFAGIGFEWYRFGKNAHHGSNAIVPFTEVVYYKNISKPYATDITEKAISLNAYYIRFGVKYTFGFSQ